MTHIPLDGRGFRLAVGLRPLALESWLERGPDTAGQLARKSELLSTNYEDVVALTGDALAPSEELYGEIVANLAEFHNGPETSRGSEHPLVAASRLVAEDLCVMTLKNGNWQLAGACVCFPSRWGLRDKIATSLDEIHAPVPGYQEQLARPATAIFDRLTAERAFWRLNWTLLDDSELFLPAPSRSAAAPDPSAWQFRVERQTLRRLERSGAIIFTIRTYVRPAAELVEELPEFASDVWRVLSSAPTATLAYKGWIGLADQWAKWFPAAREVSGTPPE